MTETLGYATLIVLGALALTILLGRYLGRLNAHYTTPEPAVQLEPAWCGECGHEITGDRCKIVEVTNALDPADGAQAMSADFHPACCPITDPDHAHAGTTVRVS